MNKIAVIGLWHQGVVGAACMADLGYDVLAADQDGKRVATLRKGKAPVFEPGLDDLIRKGLKSGRLRFTSEVAHSVSGRRDVMIMIDTPVDEDDRSDLSGIFSTIDEIAPYLESGSLLFVMAQIPVGTCDELIERIKAGNSSLRFGVAYSPENLRLGQAIDRFLHPALPVIGADDQATLDRAEELLSPLGVEWKRVNLRTSEMTKHALNAYLAVSVCFGNELGNLCDEVGADAHKVAEVLRMEQRVGSKAMLSPGLGFSGGTLARDMQTLRSIGDRARLETKLLDGAWEANRSQNRLVVRKLKKVFGSLDGLRVAVLGLTYKPNTSTLRRSAALEIIRDMAEQGASVSGHDPRADRQELAEHTSFIFSDDPYEAVKGANALVLVTAWEEYRNLNFNRIKADMDADPFVLDTNGIWDADQLEGLGFLYSGIGKGRLGGGTR